MKLRRQEKMYKSIKEEPLLYVEIQRKKNKNRQKMIVRQIRK